MPFFRIFKKEVFDGQELDENQISILIDLTKEVSGLLETELRLTGFWENIPARKKLWASLQEIILSSAFVTLPDVVKKRGQIIARVMETAEKNHESIVFGKTK